MLPALPSAAVARGRDGSVAKAGKGHVALQALQRECKGWSCCLDLTSLAVVEAPLFQWVAETGSHTSAEGRGSCFPIASFPTAGNTCFSGSCNRVCDWGLGRVYNLSTDDSLMPVEPVWPGDVSTEVLQH